MGNLVKCCLILCIEFTTVKAIAQTKDRNFANVKQIANVKQHMIIHILFFALGDCRVGCLCKACVVQVLLKISIFSLIKCSF